MDRTQAPVADALTIRNVFSHRVLAPGGACCTIGSDAGLPREQPTRALASGFRLPSSSPGQLKTLNRPRSHDWISQSRLVVVGDASRQLKAIGMTCTSTQFNRGTRMENKVT
jgi:hypothetical protein